MADKQWYYAANGKQEGPVGEPQLRAMIERGEVKPDALVWTASLSGWTRALDVPGLIPDALRPPPSAIPGVGTLQSGTFQSAPYPPSTSEWPGGEPGAALATTASVFGLFGRSLLAFIGQIFIIPSPWTSAAVYRWLVGTIELPNRKRVVFVGRGGDIWYAFILGALCGWIGVIHIGLQLLLMPLTVLFYRIIVRWLFANLTWEGQRQSLRFTGSYWGFLGWQAFMLLALFSIIGWAWVFTAQIRWMCRHVEGSSQRLSFVGTGWGVLWRSFVFGLTCIVIIPIPWMLRWYTRWLISQLCLSSRV